MASRNKRIRILNFFGVAGILLLLIYMVNIAQLSAAPLLQDVTGAEEWGDPLNMSQSGVASEPRIVVDANNVVHVIWREDALDSYFYSREDVGVWREPVAVELPFGTPRYAAGLGDVFLYNPKILADDNGRIYAFWLGDKNALFFSSVLADEFGNFDSWSERQQLAASAVDFAAVVDSANNVHLSYVRDVDSAEAGAGLYYRRMNGQNLTWAQPLAIFNSAYYRAVDAQNANIEISTVNLPMVGEVDLTDAQVITDSELITNTILGESLDSTRVLVVGDNRATEQVFAFPAVDGGSIWFEPILVDDRRLEDSELSVGPSQISIEAMGNEIHISWLAGHEANCEQYHQWSMDGGLTWQPAIMIQSAQNDCPEDYELLTDGDGLLFLLGFRRGQAYLQAWNGTAWSGPEIQQLLTGFVDPVTKRQVSLGCQQTAVTRDKSLVVVGCGSISDTVNDIWLVERPLGDEAVWFPPQGSVVWQQPELLFDSTEENLKSPVLVHGSENLLHAFWIGSAQDNGVDTGAKIYYSQWDGNSWARVIPLLPLDTIRADQLQGVMDKNNNVIITWRNPETGIHYTKQVYEPNIQIPTDWSDTQELIDPLSYATSPELYVDKQGVVNIIFASPLNENRGIYWMRNEDSERIWTDPVLIFDAAKAGWEMVDKPHMTQTGNGDLHVIMTRYTLQPEIRPESLYYIKRSRYGGDILSEPELITSGNITWSEVVGLDEHTVLIIWQEVDNDLDRVLSQQSLDSGLTWERPLIIQSSDAKVPSHTTITLDKINKQIHLVYNTKDDFGNLILDDNLWQEGRWEKAGSFVLANESEHANLIDLASAISPDGEFTILYNFDIIDDKVTEIKNSIFFTNRLYDLPENSIPQPEISVSSDKNLVATPIIPTLEAPTRIPDQSIALTELEAASPPVSEPSSPITNLLLIGIIPVFLVIGGIVVFSWVRFRFVRGN